MDDTEITRLCAEAMGCTLDANGLAESLHDRGVMFDNFNPLHDDAQAMALVKRFTTLCIHAMSMAWANPDPVTLQFDLNRAICEAVAKMQASK